MQKYRNHCVGARENAIRHLNSLIIHQNNKKMNTEILIGKSYEEAKQILENSGMQLCEYGGEKLHYAIYNYDGIRYHAPSVTLEYTLGENGCVTDAYEN